MAEQRFYTLPEVCEILNISMSQVRAMVKRGEIAAIQIGGRGQWRVEISKLEEFINAAYAKSEQHREQLEKEDASA